MVENRNNLFGIIAIIIGASGLGFGIYSIVSLQSINDTQSPPGQNEHLTIAKAFLSSGYTEGPATYKINFDEKLYDPDNAFDLATDMYNVPKEGYYLINAQFTGLSFGNLMWMNINISNVIQLQVMVHVNSGTNGATASASDIFYLYEGDSVILEAGSNTVTNLEVLGDSNGTLTYISIYYLM